MFQLSYVHNTLLSNIHDIWDINVDNHLIEDFVKMRT